MNTTTIGLDIAKRLFQAHGMDTRGKNTMTRRLKRAEVLRFFANLQPCLIGMEACASAHHWARKLSELGHTVKLIAPQFVKPYVKMVWTPPGSLAITARYGEAVPPTAARTGGPPCRIRRTQ
jgi:hypothetical protein